MSVYGLVFPNVLSAYKYLYEFRQVEGGDRIRTHGAMGSCHEKAQAITCLY